MPIFSLLPIVSLFPQNFSPTSRFYRFIKMASTDDIKQKEGEADTLLSQPAASTTMGEKVREMETGVVEVEKEKSGKYPWPLLVRTVLLLNAFLALGINDAMGGPTLLDLR